MRRIIIFTVSMMLWLQAHAQSDSLSFVFNDVPYIRVQVEQGLTQNSVVWNDYHQVYYFSGIDTTGQTWISVVNESGEELQKVSYPFESKGVWYNNFLDFPEAFVTENNSIVSFFMDEYGFFESKDFLDRIESLQEANRKHYTVYNSIQDVYAYTEPIAGLVIEASPYTGEIMNYLSLELPSNQKEYDFDQLMFTGAEASPYALINQDKKELQCFNEHGELVVIFKLPIVHYIPQAYGYSNGLLWLHDAQTGEWAAHGFVIR